MTPARFHDRRILVTGGSRGLGAELARQLASAGARVWLVARTEEDLRRVSAESGHGPSVQYSVADVSNASHLQVLSENVASAWGAIDVLINNAAIWLEGDLAANDPESLKELVLTNVLGPILTTRALLDALKNGESPTLVNIASTASYKASAVWPAYAATKHALKGFSDSMALALSEFGVRVVLVNPAGINTGFYLAAGLPHKVNQPWMMEVEDVATAVVHSLSDVATAYVARLDIVRSRHR